MLGQASCCKLDILGKVSCIRCCSPTTLNPKPTVNPKLEISVHTTRLASLVLQINLNHAFGMGEHLQCGVLVGG